MPSSWDTDSGLVDQEMLHRFHRAYPYAFDLKGRTLTNRRSLIIATEVAANIWSVSLIRASKPAGGLI